MILTSDERDSLVYATHRHPHQLMAMHPLGDGSGLVVRALLHDAAKVEVIPCDGSKVPPISMARLHESGLYEGTTAKASQVYPYELAVTNYQGHTRRMRDPYSFLPSLGE